VSLQSVEPVHGLKAIKRLEPVASFGAPTKLKPSFDQHQEFTPKLGSFYAGFGRRAGITGAAGTVSSVLVAAGSGLVAAGLAAAGAAAAGVVEGGGTYSPQSANCFSDTSVYFAWSLGSVQLTVYATQLP